MKKSYLSKGIVCVLVGICFVLAAVFTESAIDGLFWGLAIITDHKAIVLYLFGLFVFQIVIGNVVYHQLRRKY